LAGLPDVRLRGVADEVADVEAGGGERDPLEPGGRLVERVDDAGSFELGGGAFGGALDDLAVEDDVPAALLVRALELRAVLAGTQGTRDPLERLLVGDLHDLGALDVEDRLAVLQAERLAALDGTADVRELAVQVGLRGGGVPWAMRSAARAWRSSR
jgi:hypothetical protein